MNTDLLNPSVLSFVGDGVYTLLVREKLATVNRRSGDLHALSVEFVKASAQAKAFDVIKEELTEHELSVFKRGRNFHTNNTPKNSTKEEYHAATGLETLFGYLHLSGNSARYSGLFDKIWENLNLE